MIFPYFLMVFFTKTWRSSSPGHLAWGSSASHPHRRWYWPRWLRRKPFLLAGSGETRGKLVEHLEGFHSNGLHPIQSGAPVYDSVQWVNITPISLWFMVPIIIVFMGFINHRSHRVWGAPQNVAGWLIFHGKSIQRWMIWDLIFFLVGKLQDSIPIPGVPTSFRSYFYLTPW